MNKKRIILTLYVGAISLSVATLSMSLAWYEASRILRINSMDISIDCDRQLAISTKRDEGYHSSLKTEDFEELGKFYPVTSAHTEWLEQKKDKPEFYSDTVFTETEDAELSTLMDYGYFSQKLYLKSDDDVIVTINSDETFIKPKIEYNHLYAQELASGDPSINADEIELQLNTLAKAMRFSVLVLDEDNYEYVIIDPNKEVDTYYGGILDVNDDDYYDFFRKSGDNLLYERFYGEINNKEFLRYDDPLDSDSGYEYPSEEPHAFNAKHKKDIKKFNLQKSLDAGLEIKKEESYTLEEIDSNKNLLRFPVYQDKPTEIVLSIYIEGWDLESVNCTKGATFDSSLGFVIEREM